jgi:hypothetical protein
VVAAKLGGLALVILGAALLLCDPDGQPLGRTGLMAFSYFATLHGTCLLVLLLFT